MVYIYHSFFLGLWPPQEKSLFKTESVRLNLLKAHIKAYRIITAFYRKKNLGKPLVSIAQNMQAFEPCTPSLKNRLAVYLRVRSFNLDFIERCIRARALDFIGVNYYSRSLVELKGWSWKNFAMDVCDGRHSNLKKNSLGWEIYPEGFYKVLICLKKYKLPVFILENGVCTEDDSLRWDFIRSHLQELARAMDAGIKVMGYIYWSLIDNFEWDKGFAPRFGLIEVEYPSLRRTIRDSAKKFASVILEGGIK
jgi:beta-glucosidase